jgi:hypothetical protein
MFANLDCSRSTWDADSLTQTDCQTFVEGIAAASIFPQANGGGGWGSPLFDMAAVTLLTLVQLPKSTSANHPGSAPRKARLPQTLEPQ